LATRRDYEREITDNLSDLLAVLPPGIAAAVDRLRMDTGNGGLIEIVMDLGRLPEARFQDDEVILADVDVTREDLHYVAERIGKFGEDNRAGIERTLHRISAIRNRTGDIVGLTCRIGRAVYGTIAILSDLIESGESILLLGRPGVGKTTMLREVARVLADDFHKRVVIVDTSNEIAGDGDIPHPAIGRARRMQVPTPTFQHAVMIEAVENHMPEVIVIDEIGTELEAMAARTIAERGVQLIGTAHGNTLENLMMNPTLSDLIGGIQSVTLSDEEARRRGTQKSILERKAPPTFNVMVEIITRDEVAVHRDVALTVDAILRNAPIRAERRQRHDDGEVVIRKDEDARRDPSVPARQLVNGNGASSGPPEIVDLSARKAARTSGIPTERGLDDTEDQRYVPPAPFSLRGRGTESKPLRIYPFGVSRNRLEQAIQQLSAPAVIVRDVREADLVVTLKNYFRRKPQPIREAEARGTAVYVLRSNTGIQMESVLSTLLPHAIRRAAAVPETGSSNDKNAPPDVTDALEEAEVAISAVMEGSPPVSLTPQGSYVRKLQHQLADRYNLGSRSKGREPNRRVEIYRQGMQ
jgi:stage III sporulation protein SpoIIIAA